MHHPTTDVNTLAFAVNQCVDDLAEQLHRLDSHNGSKDFEFLVEIDENN